MNSVILIGEARPRSWAKSSRKQQFYGPIPYKPFASDREYHKRNAGNAADFLNSFYDRMSEKQLSKQIAKDFQKFGVKTPNEFFLIPASESEPNIITYRGQGAESKHLHQIDVQRNDFSVQNSFNRLRKLITRGIKPEVK